MAAKNKPNELYLTRFYAAPVKAVWDAICDPAQAAKWWGPRGWSITTFSKDLRPGGHWDYMMHGPGGVEMPNTTLYHEVVEHKRLVYDHGGHKDRPPLFRVTMEFTAVKGGTQLEMTMALATPEAAAEIKKFIKQAGGDSTWDRLGEYLEEEDSGKDVFLINRSFQAPLARVQEMWTRTEHLVRWLPPTGMDMSFVRADVRVGGESFFFMGDGGSMRFYGKLRYQEIAPGRLVYTQHFSDEHGGVSRHPMAPVWPEAMLVTVTFTEEGPAQTRVTVRMEGHGTTTTAEIKAFVAERPGMTAGWTGSFDKLEGVLGA